MPEHERDSRDSNVDGPGVMTAHVACPALTGGDVPATFSCVVVIDLLRCDVDFDGALGTDAPVVGAIAERCGSERRPSGPSRRALTPSATGWRRPLTAA